MPDQFKEQAQQTLDEYESVMRYTPPQMFQTAYRLFWNLRKNTPPSDTISYTEVHAYSLLYNITLEPYEIDLIKSIDYQYVGSFNKERK